MAMGLMIAGSFVFVGSVVLSTTNLAWQILSTLDNNINKASSYSSKIFARHAGAIIGIMFGEAMFLVGMTMLIAQNLN